MKILYVDLQYDYGKKERGKNIIGLDGFKKSFEKLGHNVVMFYYDEFLNDIDPMQEKLKNFADKIKPDLIFFSLYKDQFKIKTLKYLKSKYVTINWFGDDPWKFENFTSKYAPYFTYCITTDKFSIFKYKSIGQNNVIYSQWAAINTHSLPKFKDYKYDISFVGGYNNYRKWFIDRLRKKGFKIEVFGHGWKNGSLSSTDMNSVFTSSKINLNLSNSISYDIRYLFNKPINILHTIRGHKNISQIKARNFEIPYFNGFQLTDYIPTLEDYFDIGKEIVCYTTIEEAEFLIKYYLDDDNERENIKELSHKRALKEHGYINRLRRILEQISK